MSRSCPSELEDHTKSHTPSHTHNGVYDAACLATRLSTKCKHTVHYYCPKIVLVTLLSKPKIEHRETIRTWAGCWFSTIMDVQEDYSIWLSVFEDSFFLLNTFKGNRNPANVARGGMNLLNKQTAEVKHCEPLILSIRAFGLCPSCCWLSAGTERLAER